VRILPLLTIFTFLFLSCLHAEKPNVILITIDDLNDWIEPLGGHPNARTPEITKFANTGAVVFRNAVCPAPVCGPSRSSFLSGFMPHNSGVYDNATNMRDSPLIQQNPTLQPAWLLHTLDRKDLSQSSNCPRVGLRTLGI